MGFPSLGVLSDDGYSSRCTVHHGPPGMSPAGSNDLEEWRCLVYGFGDYSQLP